MRIPFTEPVSPRYIHINPKTNKVHLIVPVVSGQEISTDNTCKATVELKEFFDAGAVRELNAYKSALEFDIGLLETGHAERVAKLYPFNVKVLIFLPPHPSPLPHAAPGGEGILRCFKKPVSSSEMSIERLAQIETYIGAVQAMQQSYGNALNAFLAKPSNLHSIQLRPRAQDSQSEVINPVFNINRKNDANGTPISALYNAIYEILPDVIIGLIDPKTRLTQAVLEALPGSPAVADIQRILHEQCQALFPKPQGCPI